MNDYNKKLYPSDTTKHVFYWLIRVDISTSEFVHVQYTLSLTGLNHLLPNTSVLVFYQVLDIFMFERSIHWSINKTITIDKHKKMSKYQCWWIKK